VSKSWLVGSLAHLVSPIVRRKRCVMGWWGDDLDHRADARPLMSDFQAK
jgi:hypothetical protein